MTRCRLSPSRTPETRRRRWAPAGEGAVGGSGWERAAGPRLFSACSGVPMQAVSPKLCGVEFRRRSRSCFLPSRGHILPIYLSSLPGCSSDARRWGCNLWKVALGSVAREKKKKQPLMPHTVIYLFHTALRMVQGLCSPIPRKLKSLRLQSFRILL